VSESVRVKIWLFAAALACAGLYSFWYAFKAWAKSRVIENTPMVAVQDRGEGRRALALLVHDRERYQLGTIPPG
jgi:hypothetical protein